MHTIHVGIAELHFAGKDELLKTTLGSCVSVVLYTSPDREKEPIASMSHFLLPEPTRQEEVLRKPLRFGSILIPHQIKKMREAVGNAKIFAKITGGASMLNNSSLKIADIGRLNFEMAIRIIKKHGIEIKGMHTGGTVGRSALFIPKSGILRVTVFGEKTIDL
ncbi:MAG: hypothetical protein D6767_03415 [Candidatus Hydrogenedentota bacterium]|nr:MAG: hypothetical protein D6767_03415 [Candidatus Hydrogenedentota bacterium]